MKKMEAYQLLTREPNSQIAFMANVILTSHRNPAKKLNGLVRAIDNGLRCRLSDASMDILIVNDRVEPWSFLETLAR